jgi:hypothetical protein
MGLWSKLFGSKKVIEGVYDGIDKSFFTQEEKADYFQKMLKLYEPYKLAQRLLALIVGIPYMIVYLTSAGLYVYGVVNIDSTHLIQASKDLATLNNDNLGTPFAIILGFYFTGGVIEGSVRAFKGK